MRCLLGQLSGATHIGSRRFGGPLGESGLDMQLRVINICVVFEALGLWRVPPTENQRADISVQPPPSLAIAGSQEGRGREEGRTGEDRRQKRCRQNLENVRAHAGAAGRERKERRELPGLGLGEDWVRQVRR